MRDTVDLSRPMAAAISVTVMFSSYPQAQQLALAGGKLLLAGKAQIALEAHEVALVVARVRGDPGGSYRRKLHCCACYKVYFSLR